MEKKILKVRREKVYGNYAIYPDCDEAELFARIAGTKTLTAETIGYARQLGFDFKVSIPETV